MNLTPLVSIITPAFNSESTVVATLKSVQAQSLQDWELLVIDDSSTDRTVERVNRLAKQDNRIKVLCNKREKGPAGARNTGILMANAKYIAFLDSDDLWHPNKLENQIAFMETENSYFSYGDYNIIDRKSKISLGIYRSPDNVSYRDLLTTCPIGCLTVAFNQQVLGKHLMPNMQRGQDWGLWLALTRGGVTARRFPGCHADYLTGGKSLSASKLSKSRDIFKIYRNEENFSVGIAALLTMIHSVNAIFKSYLR